MYVHFYRYWLFTKRKNTFSASKFFLYFLNLISELNFSKVSAPWGKEAATNYHAFSFPKECFADRLQGTVAAAATHSFPTFYNFRFIPHLDWSSVPRKYFCQKPKKFFFCLSLYVQADF
jgi:hypothetical protein